MRVNGHSPVRRGRTRSPRKVAVLGGAGFIGSHLCRSLIEDGDSVICVDDCCTGSVSNVSDLLSEDFVFVQHDICRPLPPSIPSLDEIYNLACPASPTHYQADRIKTARTCSTGVFHVLERAHRDGAVVLQASTSEVYGDPAVHPQAEGYRGDVNMTGPRSCYDEGKRFAETLFMDHARQLGMRVKIARIFNTYGPRMQADDGRVVSNFVVQALRGNPLTVYGDGSQTRSLCHVGDLVRGLKRLMASPDDVRGPVNLGNPHEITVLDLARLVLELTGSASELSRCPLPVDDPRRRRPDISLARTLLKWAPETSLIEGLEDTIAWFRVGAVSGGPLARDGASPVAPPAQAAAPCVN